MTQNHTYLIVSASLCVAAAWYVRSQIPSFKYTPIITASAVAITIYVYYESMNNTRCKSTVSAQNPMGTCELDSDCNKVDPGGQCFKNATGQCGCRCSHGFSGPTCEIKGIPWNDPGCMGPNKQSPKNKSGMCVCPNENWVSGTDPKYGQVQCLKCAGDGPTQWGPSAATGAPNACTAQWKQVNLISDTCVYNITTNPSLFCADIASKYETGYPNYKGDVPKVTIATGANVLCTGECKCAGNSFEYKIPSSRGTCNVTGWVEPNISSQTCQDVNNTERACSSYQCKGWSN